jgi:hypothetical protein
MISSWDKQVLNHVNNDVTIIQDGHKVVTGARVINIDLVEKRIIVRQDKGEGPQMTIWGGSLVIIDEENYRPGMSEYQARHSPESLAY